MEKLQPNGKKTMALGVGGGCDIFTCLPWFYSLNANDKKLVHLFNYSFTEDLEKYTITNYEFISSVTKKCELTENNKKYFPEYHLANMLDKKIYALHLVPNPWLYTDLLKIIKELKIKKILLFDGGLDSVIIGNEKTCPGSPLEDSQIILAIYQIKNILDDIEVVLITSALGIEDYDVKQFKINAEILDATTIKLSTKMKGWEDYSNCIKTLKPASIIQSSIVAAVEGYRGKYENPLIFPSRIEEKEDLPNIIDETTLWWIFDIDKLVKKSEAYQKLMIYNNKMSTSDKKQNNTTAWSGWNQQFCELYDDLVEL